MTRMHDDWLTPRCILDPLRPFDLDPCAPEERLWEIATTHYTRQDDGLKKDWKGFVWCHPPHGKKARQWLKKLHAHGNGIGLVPASVNSQMFEIEVWPHATALLFITGNVLFYHKRGGSYSKTPLVLISYGDEAKSRLSRSGIPGTLVTGWSIIERPVHHGVEWTNIES